MKKIITFLLCSFMLTIAGLNHVCAAEIDGNREIRALNVNASDIKYKISVPIDAQQFAEENYCNLVMAGQEDYSFSISESAQKKLILETPFIIYNKNEAVWDEIYYYPILYNNQIILVMSVINTTEGWTLSASQELVKELNELEYQKNNIQVFCCDERNQLKEIKSNKIINELSDDIEEMQPTDIAETKKKSDIKDMKEGYTPSYSFNVTTGSDVGQILALHNRKGQGSYNICWAASVATIVNYLQGKNISPIKVCDDNGFKDNYVEQDINVKKKALLHYKVSYFIKKAALEWTTIRGNIRDKKPVAMSTFNKKGEGHAVTLTGYRFRYGNKYIVLWNSGDERVYTVLYKGEGTVIQYNNTAWTWTKSLAQYTD